MDPYGNTEWRLELRRHADEYLAADDAIRAANEELKPFRQAKKAAKAMLEELMARHSVPSVDFHEREEVLTLAARKSKKQPTEEIIRERCRGFVKNAGDADRLADFVLNQALQKVEEVVPTLRRKKARAAAADSDGENE